MVGGMKTRALLQSQALALCFEGAAVPDWVQITPAGPRLPARDGREWQLPDPDAVVRAYASAAGDGAEAPVDFEHATHVKGEAGERADAVGWVKRLENRGGALWALIDWNETGREAIASRAYRYVSPGFFFDPKTRAVMRLVSIGLTNVPNFKLPALNREDPYQETEMNPDVLKALGLAEGAAAADAVAAIEKLKTDQQLALNRAQHPDPAAWVPRADHQLALNRIGAFEAEARARADKDAEAAVDAAIAEGKIAPASRDYHLATCRAEGGLDRFTGFIATQPVIAPPSGLDGKKSGQKPGTYTEEQLAICRQFCMDPAETFGKAAKE